MIKRLFIYHYFQNRLTLVFLLLLTNYIDIFLLYYYVIKGNSSLGSNFDRSNNLETQKVRCQTDGWTMIILCLTPDIKYYRVLLIVYNEFHNILTYMYVYFLYKQLKKKLEKY